GFVELLGTSGTQLLRRTAQPMAPHEPVTLRHEGERLEPRNSVRSRTAFIHESGSTEIGIKMTPVMIRVPEYVTIPFKPMTNSWPPGRAMSPNATKAHPAVAICARSFQSIRFAE